MSESNRQTEWNKNFEQLKAFASANERWPSTTSTDAEEKAIGQWWSRQKYLLNKKAEGGEAPGISPERETLLKSFIESLSHLERDGIWDTRYGIILNQIKTHNKLWPYATTNPEEQKGIRWWNQQKTFARKFKADPSKPSGGMTQKRFDKIVELMSLMGDSLEAKAQAVPANSSDTNSVQ